jgi:hypothetical protein
VVVFIEDRRFARRLRGAATLPFHPSSVNILVCKYRWQRCARPRQRGAGVIDYDVGQSFIAPQVIDPASRPRKLDGRRRHDGEPLVGHTFFRSQMPETPDNPPQFFQDPSPRTRSTERGDLAIYRVSRRGADGAPIAIAVECAEGGGYAPRNATSLRKLAKEVDLASELDSVAAVAETVLESLKAMRPGGVEIEFGIELGGEMGIPLVTRGEAKANFKITLKWEKTTPEK